MSLFNRIFGRRTAEMARAEKPEDRARRDELDREIAEQLEANRQHRASLEPIVMDSMRYYQALTKAMDRL